MRDALAKAERFAGQAQQALPQAYETIVHNSYYAMFHAARAALLAAEGAASTNHGRVVKAFARMVRRGKPGTAAGDLAALLEQASKLRAQADCGKEDLTDAGRRLREQLAPFLTFCRSMLEQTIEKDR